MTTAIISGICAIVAATLGALVTMFVTLRSKKMDLLSKSEERKAESLDRGYNTILAAADLCWHVQCHNVLKYYGTDPPFDMETELPELQRRVDSLYSRGIDLLKANSLNYEQMAPAVVVLFRITWDGQTVSGMEARPADYEEARQLLIELSRMDSRLTKPVKKGFWKKFSKDNEPADMSKLSGDEKLRRVAAMIKSKQIEGYVSQDQDAVQAFLRSFQKNPPLYAESLIRTSSRVEFWTDEKVINFKIPCHKLGALCYKEAQELMVKLSESDD